MTMDGWILGMTVTAALMALGRAIMDERPVSLDERAERLYAWRVRCTEAEIARLRDRSTT